MAFVRWRGTCAELLASVWDQGRSHQILLANLSAPYASLGVRQQVAREYPDIHVDWLAVERALARGPKSVTLPEPAMTILKAESLLRDLAQQLAPNHGITREALLLLDAADVLYGLRADPRFADLTQSANLSPSDVSRLRMPVSGPPTARASRGPQPHPST